MYKIMLADDEGIVIDSLRFIIEKEFKDVEKLIDFAIIHAKRSVASSEEKNGTKVLSKLTTDYFNHANINAPDKFESINDYISSKKYNSIAILLADSKIVCASDLYLMFSLNGASNASTDFPFFFVNTNIIKCDMVFLLSILIIYI